MKVYVITWEDKYLKPGVFTTLEQALKHAESHGVTDFKEINAGVWKSGHWFIDECTVHDNREEAAR